jgi:hypothetical protein
MKPSCTLRSRALRRREIRIVSARCTGFRYLLARKFKLRVGVDIARGPEDFAYYIVFGSNWLK